MTRLAIRKTRVRTRGDLVCDPGMVIVVDVPGVADLPDLLAVLGSWQDDAAPLQLHPGDLGWFWRLGAEATAAAVRTWSQGGRIVAIGLLDGPDLLRLGISPEAQQDDDLARRLVDDLTAPELGILGSGEIAVEAPPGALVHDLLGEEGWGMDEPWTLLRRDLNEPVPDPGVRTDVIGADQAGVWTAVHRSAFGVRIPIEDRWHAMAAGPAYADARSLAAFDEHDDAVAAVTVWSAGPGRPGLLEPMGVHDAHRGRGHGRAITLAAAAALRELSSSSAIVLTPSANVGAVITYRSAGFLPLSERWDRRRDALVPDPQC